MSEKKKRPEDFAPNSPLRKPVFFEHFSNNAHKYAEMISFFRCYPDLWYDYLSQQGGKQIFFFRDYQRVMLRTMARFMQPYYCIPRRRVKDFNRYNVFISYRYFLSRVKARDNFRNERANCIYVERKTY